MGRSDGADLRERALRLLARREHSHAELRQKLARAMGEDAEALAGLDSLLADLEQSGLLSDQRFAQTRAVSRAKRFGNARLKQELRTQGVDDEIITSVMSELDDTAGDELARATAIWERKYGVAPDSREAWAKQARFLQSRGFSSDIIRRVLRTGPADSANGTEDDLD
jgi:regulatory protein